MQNAQIRTQVSNPSPRVPRARRAGFTLLELIVSITIMLTACSIGMAHLITLRAEWNANTAAQQLAQGVHKACDQALATEQYLAMTTTTTSFTVWQIPLTPAGLPSWTPSTWRAIKIVDFASQGGARISTGSTTVLPIGPRGWILPAGGEPAGSGGGFANSNTPSVDATGRFYRYSISAGNGIFEVRVYDIGRTVVRGPL